jgi:hypothetical protein
MTLFFDFDDLILMIFECYRWINLVSSGFVVDVTELGK